MKEEKINPFEMAKKQIAPKFQRGSGYFSFKKIPMRTAALVLGLGRVAETTKLRAIYP